MEIPNSYNFTSLSPKTTAWNEFSSTVASAIISLATNQKFNFFKWIFESIGRNLDNESEQFLMYPRFIQVFLDKQLEGLSNHERKYVAPSHTKKIFRNMKRTWKGFLGRITPLFPTMMVQSQIESVADEAVYKELDDSLVRAATTASSLEAEQDSGGGPRCQEAMRSTIAQTRSERVSKLFNDSLLARGNTLQSDADSMKLNKLIELCTTLQSRVLDLEKTKTTQALEIDSLKKRVKKLEKKQRSRTQKLKRLYKVGLSARVESSDENEDLGKDASKQGRTSDIDADEYITLVNTHNDAKMFDADKDLHGEEVGLSARVESSDENEDLGKDASKQGRTSDIDADECITLVNTHDDAKMFDADKDLHVSTAETTATISIDEFTLAQALVELKHTKPKAKAKGIAFHEPEESTTTTAATIPKLKSQDNGKAIMVEEPVKLKKKDQIMLDEEVALKLQAELQAKFDKEQRLAKEQQELTDAEKATLFMQFLEKKRKFFAAKAAEEKRNKPPIQAQQRKIICTYVKNMEGKKLKDLKNKSFDNFQELFDKAMKRVNTFVDYNTELVEENSKKAKVEVMEESSKRTRTELEQESSKKQKVDDDKEITKLKQLVKIIPDEEGVAIDAIPLAVKPPSIVDWKNHKE
nr:hypothetical protein [Tanacetum cinerariifolium]